MLPVLVVIAVKERVMQLTITETITKTGYQVEVSAMKSPANNRIIAHQANKQEVMDIVRDLLGVE